MIPEIEQSFQTLRADDEAINSYDDEENGFFAQVDPSIQLDEPEYMSTGVREKESERESVNLMELSEQADKGTDQTITNKKKIMTNQTTKKVSTASSVVYGLPDKESAVDGK
jgi:hypothetical protein